jgi:hypothetical protein
MSLSANTSITLNGTTYVEEPKLEAMVAAVQALCASAGHPEWLPATITRTIGSTVYVYPPKLAELESALRKLGATAGG